METVEVLFFVFAFLTIYPFVFYPFILFVLNLIFKRKLCKENNFEPTISIITPVHNEEENIVPLVESIVHSGYPLTKIQFIFGSDGSTDQTNELIKNVAKRYNFVEYYLFPKRGKNFVINQLVPKAKNNIIVFIDADIRLAPGSLHKLLSYFKDNTIGGVASNLVIAKGKSTEYTVEEQKTQKFLGNIRIWESNIYSTVNNNGPFYAIRREMFAEIPNDKVCDDFYLLLKVLTKGKRMVLAKDAIAFDVRKRFGVWKEFHRKMRFSAGGLSSLLSVPEILLHPLFLFFIISHKLLRWFAPWFLLISLVLLIFTKFTFIKIAVFSIIGLFFLLIILGIVDLLIWKRGQKIFNTPLYIFFSLVGSALGIFRAFTGKQNSNWTLEGLVTKNEKT